MARKRDRKNFKGTIQLEVSKNNRSGNVQKHIHMLVEIPAKMSV